MTKNVRFDKMIYCQELQELHSIVIYIQIFREFVCKINIYVASVAFREVC